MNFNDALPIAGIAAEIIVLGLMLRRSLWRTLPFFFALVCCDLFTDVSIAIVERKIPGLYLKVYFWEMGVGFSSLQFAVLIELAWSVLRPSRASLPRAALPVLCRARRFGWSYHLAFGGDYGIGKSQPARSALYTFPNHDRYFAGRLFSRYGRLQSDPRYRLERPRIASGDGPRLFFDYQSFGFRPPFSSISAGCVIHLAWIDLFRSVTLGHCPIGSSALQLKSKNAKNLVHKCSNFCY